MTPTWELPYAASVALKKKKGKKEKTEKNKKKHVQRTFIDSFPRKTYKWKNALHQGNANQSTCYFMKWLNMELLFHPVILLLGMYPREMKAYVHAKLVLECS